MMLQAVATFFFFVDRIVNETTDRRSVGNFDDESDPRYLKVIDFKLFHALNILDFNQLHWIQWICGVS